MKSGKVIVVLGPGRSGTSLVMQVLRDLGMIVSENLTEASVANPLGPYEDKEMFDLQSTLINELGGNVTAPMPEGWLQDKAAIRAVSTLATLMQSRLEQADGIFGFKDPKTSMLIPLWVRVFNKLKLTPAYILAVRDPRATVASFLMQYNQPAHVAELVWLVRTVEALDNTAGACFIAHYEDWFAKPQLLAQTLLHYTGLDQEFKENLSDVLARNVKSSLNRASMDNYVIKNPFINKIYEVLKECNGADFDRQRLMAVVKECRQSMEGFKGWYQQAHQANKKLADIQTRLNEASVKAERIKELESRIKELEKEALLGRQLAAQVQKLQRQLDQLLSFS